MYYEMLQNRIGHGMTKYAGMEKQALTLQQLTQMYMRAQAKGPLATKRFEKLLAKRNAAIRNVRDSRKAVENRLWENYQAADMAHGHGLIDRTTYDAIKNQVHNNYRRRIPKGKYVFPNLTSRPMSDRLVNPDFTKYQAPMVTSKGLNYLLRSY